MSKQYLHLTYKFADKFNELCIPLFGKSPITFCSLGRIHKDGSYSGLMSDPTWTDLYLKKHYQPSLTSWVENAINVADAGFCLWSISDFFSRNSATIALHEDCNLFQYNNGINIVNEYPDHYEVATFASPRADGIDSFFLEKQDLLQKFILFMKEKILQDSDLNSEINHHYALPSPINNDLIKQPSVNDDLKIYKFYLGFPLPNDQYLTRREYDCLLPFILGIPKKKVAERLNLSVRTIETHLDKIKQKCHVEDLVALKLLFANNKTVSALLPNTLQHYL